MLLHWFILLFLPTITKNRQHVATASPFGNSIPFRRYPASRQKALQAWNAADELIWEWQQHTNPNSKASVLIAHDRFGVQTCLWAKRQPQLLVLYASQQKAIQQQLETQGIDIKPSVLPLLEPNGQQHDIAVLKVPKSLDLFEWYLQRIHQQLRPHGQLIAAFMTKYFSAQLLQIAAKYFDTVTQSRAKKKARLLLLSSPKQISYQPLIHSLHYKDKLLEQYYGVFSSKRIDAATLFLLQHLKTAPAADNILDVGTGNGILAWQLSQWHPQAHIYLTDDAALAIASAQRNMGSSCRYHFMCNDTLHEIAPNSIGLAVSNPPFHFEYENNIEVSLSLFQQIHKVLQVGGHFYCVANKHLNYGTHLEQLFADTTTIAQNTKYEIIKTTK